MECTPAMPSRSQESMLRTTGRESHFKRGQSTRCSVTLERCATYLCYLCGHFVIILLAEYLDVLWLPPVFFFSRPLVNHCLISIYRRSPPRRRLRKSLITLEAQKYRRKLQVSALPSTARCFTRGAIAL